MFRPKDSFSAVIGTIPKRPLLGAFSILLVMAALLVGCSSPSHKTSQASPIRQVQPTTTASCTETADVGFESPGLAFSRYADAINGEKWCEAASTFVSSARVELAEANFKALILLAGASNPKREAYQAQLAQFCARHALACTEPAWAEQAAADLMTGTDIAPKLTEFHQAAREQPAQYYEELMEHMSAADPSAIAKIDGALVEVQAADDRATGKAKQRDGRTSGFTFVRTAKGWMLAVR